MARIQYQRSAKAGGYRPQQVDERNIARLREETARQIEGMRQAANAEIESRREVARSMREDAAYTARAEERNFQIQTQNTQREIAGLQAKAQRDVAQYNANAKATQSIFESISSFSSTASKIAGQIQEQKNEETFVQDSLKETDKDEKFRERAQELALREYDLNKLQAIEEAELTDADKVLLAGLKSQSTALGFDATAGEIYQYTSRQHKDGLNAHVKAVEQQLGRPLTYEEKKQELSNYTGAVLQLIKNAGLSSKYARRVIEGITQHDKGWLNTAYNQKKQEDDEITLDRSLTNVQQADPANLNNVWITSYRYAKSIVGPTRALDLFQQKVFNVQDPKTGEFLRSEDEIANLPVFTDKGELVPFAKKYSDKQGRPTGRWAEILSERVKLQNQFRQQQIQSDKLSHSEIEQQLFRAFKVNPTEDNAIKSQQMYVSITGKESVMLANAAKHLTYKAQERQETINRISNLRDFELNPEIVAAAVNADPTKGAAIKQRHEAYNAKWKSAGYKKAKTGLEGAVSGTTAIGTNKPASNGAQPVINYLHAELESRTALYESTLGFEAAYLKAGAELEQEYKNGFRDETSKYYRKVHRNGTVSYPNLPVGKVSAAEAIKRDVDDIRADVKAGGLRKAIKNYFEDNPERVEYIVNNYDKPTFRPNPQELALKGMLNGMPLHSMYNEGFNQIGNPTRLASPLQSNGQDIVLTPAQQKIMDDPYAGPNAKLSVLRSVLNPSSFQDHGTMRPGPIANAVRVQTAVSGQGFTAESLNDAYGRPIVFGSSEALSGFQRLIQLSGGRVKASDITSSQRSHVHNEKVGGSSTSYHREGVGLAFDISAGPALEWMRANPELVKQAGFSTEPGYKSAHGHYVFGL